MMLLLVPAVLITLSFIYEYIFRKKTSLENRHVVVIGGSSGIGKSVACLAAKNGANVTILARNITRLEEAAEEIKKHRKKNDQSIKFVSLDVVNHEVVQKTLLKIDDESPVYMLVNCAGLAICGTIEDVTVEDVKKLFEINYYGTHYAIRALVPRMKTRKEGSIVITGSQASLIGIYGLSAYSATKFALRGLAEALCMELQPYNVTVTLALPPDTDTPGFAEENKSKPEETKLISGTAGVLTPESVAETMLDDAKRGYFFSSLGLESFLLTTLCVGMTSPRSLAFLVVQVMLLGPFRLLAAFYVYSFKGIVTKCAKKAKKIN